MLDANKYEVLSFDCYGTLVDWESGIISGFRPVLRGHHVEATCAGQGDGSRYRLDPPAGRQGGFGATPPAEAEPDLEVSDLESLVSALGLRQAGLPR